MGLMSLEMSLDLKPSYVPETINGFLREVSMIADVTERLDKVDQFVKRLEEEMEKIELFKRDLPLSIVLLKDAILALKQESAQYRTRNAHQPVLEEFIPLRRENGGGENTNTQDNTNKVDDGEDSSRDKKNWMSSVQLWSADKSPITTAQNCNQNQNQTLVSESRKGDDKRHKLFCGDLAYPSEKGIVPMIHTYPNFPELGRKVDRDQDVSVPGLSLVTPGITHSKQDLISSGLDSAFGGNRISSSSSNVQSNVRTGNQQPTSRKQRRCWSPELHRRFVDALTQLGGPQVATPKQIRELMQVDGLTNDEVKSHLQKYRLHTKRAPNKSSNSTNENKNSSSNSWASQDSSKPSNSPSGSPQGPLQFPGITGGDSMEEEEHEKSESHSSKGHSHRSTAKTEG